MGKIKVSRRIGTYQPNTTSSISRPGSAGCKVSDTTLSATVSGIPAAGWGGIILPSGNTAGVTASSGFLFPDQAVKGALIGSVCHGPLIEGGGGGGGGGGLG